MSAVIAIGGVGKENASLAGRTLVEHHPVSAIISMGYAGALNPELVRGDIVLSSYSMVGPESRITLWEQELEHTLNLVADQSHEHHVYVSPLYTADRIVARHHEKRKIHEQTGADIVDMESFSLFRIAREEHIPFLGIHSVTDTADEDIPALEVINPFLTSKSLWRYPRIFWDILARPKFVYDLAVLNHDAQIAGQNLAHFMKANQDSITRLIRQCIASYPKGVGGDVESRRSPFDQAAG